MSANGGLYAPPTRPLEPRTKPCCTACQRGTKALPGGCGRPACKCHRKGEK